MIVSTNFEAWQILHPTLTVVHSHLVQSFQSSSQNNLLCETYGTGAPCKCADYYTIYLQKEKGFEQKLYLLCVIFQREMIG